MRKLFSTLLYRFATRTGWRWMALVAGVALLSACSGKSEKKTESNDSTNDTEMVTCYEPVADTTVIARESSDTAADKNIPVLRDTVEPNVPIHKCYVPVRPQE